MSNMKGSALAMSLALVGIISSVSLAASEPLRILNHEPVHIAKSTGDGANRQVSFDAFGRRFDLQLELNERISGALDKSLAGIEPLRGTVAGMPGSWVRLTRGPNGWRGMFFDGNELYGIEPASDIAQAAVQPLAASGNAPVVFRLADVLVPSGAQFCGTEMATDEGASEKQATALSVYESVTAELAQRAAQQYPTRRVRVGVVVDSEFAANFESRGIAPEEAVIARMNIVDGIFSTQLGMKVELGLTTVFRNGADSFTKSKPLDLLEELRRYRRGSSAQRTLGLTHLMTGRDLSGETVGIAYMGSVCDGENAASLSEGTRSTTAAALIVAHEIGHNFNSPHDGESGACSTVTQSFIMAPRLNGNDQFSSCSVAQMRPTIARASCLTNYTPADAGLEVSSGTVQRDVNTSFALSFVVRAVGEEPSSAVITTAVLPAGLDIQSAMVPFGNCTSGAGSVFCEVGTLAPGESREVALTLTGATTGSFPVNLAVASSNDSAPGNNSGAITVMLMTPGTTATQTSTTTATSGGGGGGGRMDALLLLLLSGAAVVRVGRSRLTRAR